MNDLFRNARNDSRTFFFSAFATALLAAGTRFIAHHATPASAMSADAIAIAVTVLLSAVLSPFIPEGWMPGDDRYAAREFATRCFLWSGLAAAGNLSIAAAHAASVGNIWYLAAGIALCTAAIVGAFRSNIDARVSHRLLLVALLAENVLFLWFFG